jgi:flagellar biogenesis protein FliO
MRRHGIPAASSETFSDLGAALAFVQAAAYPLVKFIALDIFYLFHRPASSRLAS